MTSRRHRPTYADDRAVFTRRDLVAVVRDTLIEGAAHLDRDQRRVLLRYAVMQAAGLLETKRRARALRRKGTRCPKE